MSYNRLAISSIRLTDHFNLYSSMNRVGPKTPQIDRHASRIEQFSRLQYTILWAFMVFLHIVCAIFLISCVKLYWIMESKYNDYFADLLAPPRDRHFRVVGAVLGVLGGAHALQLFAHLVASTVFRSLTVRPLNFVPDIQTWITFIVDQLIRLGHVIVYRWRIHRNCRRRQQISRQDPLSNGEVYDQMFAFRKAVEMATQIPNAYMYSKLITRSWINHTKVALVVVNCWSAFIIHKLLLKRSPSAKKTSSQICVRVMAVVIDTLLAVTTGILLPGAIVLPYLLHFDFRTLDFPDAMLYGDTAFPNLVLENRAFFATSWDNAIMKVVPHVNAFFCLQALSSMIDSETHRDSRTTTMSGPPPQMQTIKKRSIIAVASFRALAQVTDTLHRVTRLHQRIYRVVVPLLFLITGGIILAFHLTAQYDNAKDFEMMSRICLQRMHPWLAPNSSCAVVRYNCYKEGVATPVHNAFSWLEREAVRKIIFMHCSEFVMPSIIREFPSLMNIELWNITLSRWGEEAAVSAKLHPMMLCIFFSLVNLSSVPAGIVQTDLPEHLTDLEFSRTNLTTLPKEIVKSWRGIKVLYVEHSHLNSFPPTLMQLPVLSELSLIGNNIKTIPESVFSTGSSPYYYDLALSHNPLRQLPDVNLNTSIFNLALEFTRLTALPAWIDTNVRVSLSLGGSTLCDFSHVNLPKFARCGHDNKSWDPLSEERFPSKLVEPFRSLSA